MKHPRYKENPDHVLVYSSDPSPKQQAQEQGKEGPYSIKPSIKIEHKGRGGKSVTVLFKLPAHETLLKALSAHLKKLLGSGGTSYIKEQEGFVEIQGEHDSVTVTRAVSKFTWP